MTDFEFKVVQLLEQQLEKLSDISHKLSNLDETIYKIEFCIKNKK